ncbi:MAG: glucoamylase family protein, partial [Gemmatimonadales bacterium]
TYVQREYARDNPGGFAGYGGDCWGITASDGPGPGRRRVAGVPRRFWHYRARGVPNGPDDGTISPWSLVASLPFAPELVIPSIEAVLARYPGVRQAYGFTCSFNPTWTAARGAAGGWVSPVHYAINQGPAALMIENFRSELVWRLLRGSPYVVEGLRRAGFQGGWLTVDPEARAGPRRPLAARRVTPVPSP